ncbi:MAG: hypothetical protein KDK76_06220 [Chlamydiia bacterium]|nr:hypothetical protein [Chlamydiia bacterium]
MSQIPEDSASKEKLHILLYQLSEQLKNPPIVIDLHDWRESVEIIMKEIEEFSPYVFERLEDLVVEAIRLANIHVLDLDKEAPPKEVEHSAIEYQEQIAFVSSEINAIKSL